MTRNDWKQIAEERLLAAQALIAGGHWSSAYYLAGYAAECGLKSCVIARVAREPELIYAEKRYSEHCWTHDLRRLVELAGLEGSLLDSMKSDRVFQNNWLIVEEWDEASRYKFASQTDAEQLIEAINQQTSGVLPWIKLHW